MGRLVMTDGTAWDPTAPPVDDQEQGEGDRFRDFDADLGDTPPPRFRAYGRVYELPREMPARTMLRFVRAKQGQDQPDGWSVVETLFVDLLGRDQYDQLIEDGASLSFLLRLQDWVMETYGLRIKDRSPGEAQAEPTTGSA